MSQLYHETCKYSLYYTLLAILAGVVMFGMNSIYRFMGEKTTTVMRLKTFEYVIKPSKPYLHLTLCCVFIACLHYD